MPLRSKLMSRKNPPRKQEAEKRSWDLEEIRHLIELMEERDLTEFEMEKGGVRVHILRGGASVGLPASAGVDREESSHAAHAQSSPSPTASHAHTEPLAGESTEGLHLIKSPIVGTYYAAPTPGAPPFVKLGDAVAVGQVLCIIEAMKLMNEIESDVAGEIVRNHVENGHPVEYGQSLFAINPSHSEK